MNVTAPNVFDDGEKGAGSPDCNSATNSDPLFVPYRFYLADLASAKSLACIEADDTQACTELGMNQASAGDGSGIRVMSWNLCRADADCGNLTPLSDSQRADLNTKLFAETLPDIAGLTEADQVADKLKKSPAVTSNYDIFESKTRSILWKKALFTKTKDGTFNMSEGRDDMPWVKLRSSSTGKEFYAVTIHTQVASGPARTIDANKTVDLIKTKLNDAPVVIIGDMNSQYPGHDSGHKGNEVYDVFTRAGYTLTFNVALQKINDDCQTSHSFEVQCGDKNGSHIDAIYYANAPGTVVSVWELIKNETSQMASDHRPIMATLSIPGIMADSLGDSNISKDGWVWPVPDVKTLGVLGYGEKGSKGIHKGIDIGPGLGKKVVAAHDGTVVKVTRDPVKKPFCGDYVTIKATGTPYYASYQHLNGAAISVKEGDTVQAGQMIATIGSQGGTTCGSFFHLHFSIETKNTISEYADPFPNGTVDPLKVLPR